MAIRALGYIVTAIIIVMVVVVLLNINFDENKEDNISDVNKFEGTWHLVNISTDPEENQNPDTTEENDNTMNYEMYNFFKNGSYYHIVGEDNSSGMWILNNSSLILSTDYPYGNLSLSYHYIFSDDNKLLDLNIIDDPSTTYIFEKIK